MGNLMLIIMLNYPTSHQCGPAGLTGLTTNTIITNKHFITVEIESMLAEYALITVTLGDKQKVPRVFHSLTFVATRHREQQGGGTAHTALVCPSGPRLLMAVSP